MLADLHPGPGDILLDESVQTFEAGLDQDRMDSRHRDRSNLVQIRQLNTKTSEPSFDRPQLSPHRRRVSLVSADDEACRLTDVSVDSPGALIRRLRNHEMPMRTGFSPQHLREIKLPAFALARCTR